MKTKLTTYNIDYSASCATPEMADFIKSQLESIMNSVGIGGIHSNSETIFPTPDGQKRWAGHANAERAAISNLTAKTTQDQAEENMCSWAKTSYKLGAQSERLVTQVRSAVIEAHNEMYVVVDTDEGMLALPDLMDEDTAKSWADNHNGKVRGNGGDDCYIALTWAEACNQRFDIANVVGGGDGPKLR